MGHNQTNNLQQAIDEMAKGPNKADDALGVPPMPPMEGEGVPSAAPFSSNTKTENGPSAEQILSDSLSTTPAAPEVAPVSAPAAPAEVPAPEVNGDLASIRESVIKDLLPLMDKVDSTPEEKFEIYKDAMKTMHDPKTIGSAYKTAMQIGDETKKADALLGLMKTIDNA